VPLAEKRNGLQVHHPRYLLLPKVGMTAAPYALARAGLRAARELIESGYDFDLIDAHYFYPDGVAAVKIGETLGKPVVITARGSDINQFPGYALPRRMIINAAHKCSAMITVCAALKDELVALGADDRKITVLRNGVDLKLFSPERHSAARAALGVTRFCLASVGHLIPRKAHDLVIAALDMLPDVELFIAGDGPEGGRLRAMAASINVADRVHFLGSLPQERLRTLYSAADALVLASSREGWANVLLEAMACGTPVIASNVWGTPEVVAAPEAGLLMHERTPAAIAHAVTALRTRPPNRLATRRYAEQFSWDATTRGQVELFSAIARGGAARPAGATVAD
jgi:glycosyltransferase involved in cell wall biosynthesis